MVVFVYFLTWRLSACQVRSFTSCFFFVLNVFRTSFSSVRRSALYRPYLIPPLFKLEQNSDSARSDGTRAWWLLRDAT